jgi:hypothetical protein
MVCVAGVTYGPLIFHPLHVPHRTRTHALRPRHLSSTSEVSCQCCVMSCLCHVSVTSVPCHLHLGPCPNPGPVMLHNSVSPEASLCFWPLLQPSGPFSLFLCLHITWTILSSFLCINSGPPTLPVPHLSLFWLWAQVSLHLYIVRDLLTSGFGHRSTDGLKHSLWREFALPNMNYVPPEQNHAQRCQSLAAWPPLYFRVLRIILRPYRTGEIYS